MDSGPHLGPPGGMEPSPPSLPKCPTIQMASIPEVTLPGGGGSDKVTFPLFSPLPASQLLNLCSSFSQFISTSIYERPALYFMLLSCLFSKPWLPHS